MLVEFRVKNFLSIREEQVLSMVASSDDALPDNVFEANGERLLRTTAIYGANASGKSNLYFALSYMRDIVNKSAVTNPNTELPITPFMLDETSHKEPTTLEITFLLDEGKYRYGFKSTSKEIIEEWLLFYPNNSGKPQSWVKRGSDDSPKKSWASKFVKGQVSSLQKKTRENALYLSVCAQWNNKQLKRVFDWITSSLRTISSDDELFGETASLFLQDHKQDVQDLIKNTMEYADFGIFGIDVKKLTPEMAGLPESIPQEFKDAYQEQSDKGLLSRVRFDHRGEISGKPYSFPFHVESQGTQKFFRLLGPWHEALLKGACIVVDELAAKLHPFMTKLLIKLMQDPKVNLKGCQLIFTTHDTTLMTPKLLRRDQIWFTKKSFTGATSLYSLHDFKEDTVRKDEIFNRAYLAGKYGALPIIQSFEDLDVKLAANEATE